MKDRCRGTRVACYTGFFIQAIVNNFLPVLFIALQDRYALSYEALGRIILVNFCTQLAADILTPVVHAKLGFRGTAPLCQGVAAAGLILMAVLPGVCPDPYIGLLIPVVIYAFGSGMMEVVLSPIVDLLPDSNHGGRMPILHSFFCWGQAVTVIGTTLMIRLFGFGGWQFIPLVWAVIPAVNALCFLRVPLIEQDARRRVTAREMLRTRQFACFVIFMFCAGASETCMSQWASMFAEQDLGVSKVLGDLLGPCAFAIFMGIGRLAYGGLAGRYSIRRAMIFNNLLCFGCYLTAGLCRQPVLALAACALCGFAVSLSWPGTYTAAAAVFPSGGTLMFSIFALCGDLGCSTGPWLLGVVADYRGLPAGFLLSAVFPLLMILAALLLLREHDCPR